MRILIIVPAYNEEANLTGLIAEIKTNIQNSDILIIDDASQDNTPDLVKKLNVEILELPFNLGIGGAVQVGYKFALEMDYDVVIRIDGDGQHPPSEASKLLQTILNDEADMAIGSRYKNEGNYESQRLRKMGTKLFSRLVSLMIKQRITDATSGFTAVNRNALKILCSEVPRDYPEVESLVIMHRHKMRITEIPVKMKRREGGRSSIGAWKKVYYTTKVLLALLIRMGEAKKT